MVLMKLHHYSLTTSGIFSIILFLIYDNRQRVHSFTVIPNGDKILTNPPQLRSSRKPELAATTDGGRFAIKYSEEVLTNAVELLTRISKTVSISSLGSVCTLSESQANRAIAIVKSANLDVDFAKIDGRWRMVYSVSPRAIPSLSQKTGENDDVSSMPTTRYISPESYHTWTVDPDNDSSGDYENQSVTFGGSMKITFKGRYKLDRSNLVQTINYETVDVNGWSVDMSEGSMVRRFVRRIARSSDDNSKLVDDKFDNDDGPKTYAWFYIDDDICLASDTTGFISLWSRMLSR